jgi:serine/threonine protein kinase
MSPELHQRVRGIFDKVLDRPESERLQFLREICGSDQDSFRAVERLLEAHSVSSFFLDRTSPSARRFGRYVISRELGRGGMGIVYEATDPLIGRSVAVKIIHIESLAQPGEAGSMRDRLFREARSAGSLSHPGIVTIFDVGQEGDEAFIAMERVNGPSLQQMLASSPRPACMMALDILRQCAAALDYAHRHGVIHRDVKPANIMLHEGASVKITDFGIAKLESAADETRTSGVLGTPSHMSPEQIGAKPLDGRSDQFSLATVAFQLLTGSQPFRADSVATLLHQILYGERPSARALNSALPPTVDKILQRGLEKAPALRYATCTEFIKTLEKAIQDAPAEVLTETVTLGIEPVKPGATPRRWPLVAAAAVLPVVATALYFSGILPSRPSAAKTQPQAPETTHVVAQIKPSPVAPVNLPAPEAAEPLPATPPTDDKAARARKLYDQAVNYRKEQEQEKSIDLLRQAADLGNIRAMVELGETLMNGGDSGLADYTEAIRWLRAAAYKGDSAGMVDLGGMYLLGNGVEEDFGSAAQWFSKAAAAGNPAAMYDLGTMYENGQGVAEDHDKARQLYAQAASLGNREAQRRLAEITRSANR